MTNDKPLLLGSHVSMSGRKMLLGSSEEAASYGATTFMIYTGAPQNTRRKPIEELNIEAGHLTYGGKWTCQILLFMPRILSILQTRQNLRHFRLGVDFLQKEIERTAALGVDQIVLHPGAHVGAGVDARNCKNY